jgi:CubicO group peptidase (beta-lactamase class C family)
MGGGDRLAEQSGFAGVISVLALIAERVSGVPFHRLVRDRVCVPAGMNPDPGNRPSNATSRQSTPSADPGFPGFAPARSPTQIGRFGMASSSHLGDQVADHIGGSVRVSVAG